MTNLEVNNLTVQINPLETVAGKQENTRESLNPKQVLTDVTFSLLEGDVMYLLGPNGAGKSALLHTLAGSPLYKVLKGEALFTGQDGKKIDLLELPAHKRALLGVYLSFQEPVPIAGLKTIDMLFNMYRIRSDKDITAKEFEEIARPLCKKVGLEWEALFKELNQDYSGGEKKRLEVLTILLFKPTLLMLDELDSGLDIDSERRLFTLIKEYVDKTKIPVIVVSHNLRIPKILPPTKAVVLNKGEVVAHGGPEIVNRIIEQGYKDIA